MTVSANVSTAIDPRRRPSTPVGGCRRLPAAVVGRDPLRSGMTMIELGVVMGIVTVLLALVLGLSRHVNEIVKIRRAQTELGEWHEALNRWYLQFGEYPFEAVNVETGEILEPDLITDTKPSLNLSNILDHCYMQYTVSGSKTNVTFRSYLTARASHIDPWGIPYIYACDPGRKAYTLYSCGPDSSSKLNNRQIGLSTTPDPTLDDIHFER